MAVGMIQLRNLNNDESEKWTKFWTCFDAWFKEDAAKDGFIKSQLIDYEVTPYGERYELSIPYEKDYNYEFGESYPFYANSCEYDNIKKFLEIAYKRWIDKQYHSSFTRNVNKMLKRFELSYHFENGKLAGANEVVQDHPIGNTPNDIKLNKGTKLYTAFDIYTVKKEENKGGNAKIYRVRNLNDDEVAVKVLFRQSGSKAARICNEILFGERNENENILHIFDRGALGSNLVFYVMPLAKESLRDRIKRGILPQDALDVFYNLIKGLEFAHSQKVYHRDIKPENILFMDDGNKAIISDFGIAHFSKEQMVVDPGTKASDRLANFQYAAPEQRIKGNAKLVDGRADIYSAGLILNEMFTGNLVAGNNYQQIGDVVSEYSFLDEIFDKMHCQKPEERIFPATEILKILEKHK